MATQSAGKGLQQSLSKLGQWAGLLLLIAFGAAHAQTVVCALGIRCGQLAVLRGRRIASLP
jgi:hypothetical protein